VSAIALSVKNVAAAITTTKNIDDGVERSSIVDSPYITMCICVFRFRTSRK